MFKDVIVVGGGIIGMLTTRLLHQAGLDVMLIDQGELGSESTWSGGGILSPLYPWHYSPAISVLARYSQQRYADLCRTLQAETGVDPQWLPSGLLISGDQELAAAQAWAQMFGAGLQHLADREAVLACEPQAGEIITSGLFLPGVAQMRNPRIAHALRTSLRLLPITLAEFARVDALEQADGRVIGVRIGADTFRAGKVILAAGAWTGQFPEVQSAGVTIQPVLGQMLLFRGPKGWLQRMILHEGRYLIPRKDGRILCGSTLEMNGFHKHTTEQARELLREVAYSLMPALREWPLQHHWSGLRPGSPNGVPYIGEHPSVAGLYVNAGHYRYGVTLALASAQLLTDLILERTPCVDPAPYRLDAERIATAEFLNQG